MDEYESLSHTRWECLGSQVRELRAFRPFRCLKCGIFGSGERFAHDLLHQKINNSRYPLPRPKRIYAVLHVVPLQSAPNRPSVPDSHAARRARSASQPSESAPALHLFRAPAIGKDSIRRGRSNLAILYLPLPRRAMILPSLRRILHRMNGEALAVINKVAPPYPEGYVDQSDQCGHFNERTDNADECLT